ncbi:hypothetical protein [Amycolatopsis keratiniphila]|uniref:hypothetical protein n=1 Tax=Amycolatopsis keratiniphila TaxID=129921 RepID=UPI00087986F1|nr:hypothetical protein [Amycolatopsis keratiniphila]OLZ58155.1 hypothetical protein BS330_13125 [Amycolatopsis keratiniphila subsp. nogabecina]SDU44564.1 hypothetical protein SAMN04489733_4363 [Amycolatopsis keratiniphila]
MSDEPVYPPHHAMPDDVRARMRSAVREGIAKPRRKARVWYAAAAAVVLVASGVAAAAQSLRQQGAAPGPEPAAGGLTLDTGLATSSLDRCWAAVRAAGKSDRLAPREEWVPLFTDVMLDVSVVAATAAGKPMFCETTLTTVTVSDPDAAPAYAPGTRTGLLLQSATGMIGGVLDPAWPGAGLAFQAEDSGGGDTLEASPLTHQFVSFTWTAPAKTRLSVYGPAGAATTTLPSAPPPLLSTVDRPIAPADRTSPAGRALDECLSGAVDAVSDAAGYRPGALLDKDGYRVVLGRLGDRSLACTTVPDPRRPGRTKMRVYQDHFELPPTRPRTIPMQPLGGVEDGGERGNARTPYAGTLLPETAVTVTCDFGAGRTSTTDVVDRTFVVFLPKEMNDPFPQGVGIQARDAHGAVVFEGAL